MNLPADRELRGLRRLAELSLELASTRGVQDTLQAVADATLALLGADRAFVLLSGHQVFASAYAPGFSGTPSLSVARFALEKGRDLIVADIRETHLGAAHSVMQNDLATVAAIPLSHEGEVLGALYADSRRALSELQEDVWLVRAYASHAAVALLNMRRLSASARRERSAREAMHDIRNLVGGIEMGLAELDELDLPDWAAENVQTVRQMNQLALQTATLAVSKNREAPVQVELATVLERCVGLVANDAKRRDVRVRLEVVPATIKGVQTELSRLFHNLLGNALKFAPPGSEIHVHLAHRDDCAVVRIADEGPGIPPHELTTIFQSGRQGSQASEGFGLGLGICRTVVKRHRGTIRAENGERGAIFVVTIPTV